MSSSQSNPTQISPLPSVNRFITTTNDKGLATFQSSESTPWAALGPEVAFNLLYTTSGTPVSFVDDADLIKHEEVAASGDLGFSIPNGSILRYVDTAPSTSTTSPFLHRTKSLDYGIVISGEIELILDSGESRVMKAGDVAIQRATKHAWKNNSTEVWARMIFIQLDCKAPVVNGKELGDDFGELGEEQVKGMFRAMNGKAASE